MTIRERAEALATELERTGNHKDRLEVQDMRRGWLSMREDKAPWIAEEMRYDINYMRNCLLG